jgi:hypothetical protein
MKKNALFLLSVLMPVLVLLASCATTELKLENPETDYNKYPVVSGHNILKAEISLNGYTLSLEKSITKETDLPSVDLLNLIFGDDSKLSGGRFSFRKGSEKICDVYIYRKSKSEKNAGITTETVTRRIDIVRGKNDIREYELAGSLGSSDFLSVKENGIQIDFGFYREPGNKFGGLISMNNAYKISVNGKPYGILALKKNSALYELKSAALADEALKDGVMMWVLAAYEEQSMQSAF